MAYTDVKKVRDNNGQQFIDDFKRCRSIVAYAPASKLFLDVPRWRVWDDAKSYKIHYFISNEIFRNGRDTLVIV